ncbi:winged helix DNA-binding domain-containing protein [Micromonospora sonneratiae]|uniref:Winged helix DNA-binding domain-containing protein n=1 Tax=Micromonospora sonneratiae TaxID=1184706 RepID=A0ABW3YCW1_9ACTN
MSNPPTTAVLSSRTLNRAAMHRQLLLQRGHLPPGDAVAHLVGMQAQAPNSPYIGLWSRLENFHHRELTDLLYNRHLVRGSVLRGTQHLVTARDYRWLRPLMQPALDRGRQAAFGRDTAGMDLAELGAVGRALLHGQTLTRPQLRDRLAERWPDRNPEALAWSVQALVPVVHPPPSGTWGRGGATPFTLAEDWLGEPLATRPRPEDLIRRYLAAYGPATVADIQTWSGLTRLREIADRISHQLRTFRDDAGNEVLDLPDAPLPDPDIPAPPRFLPAFDNLIVAYANRTRLMTDATRKRVCIGAMIAPTILIDGHVAGTWKIAPSRGHATLLIEPFTALPKADHEALTAEGAKLLAFTAPTDTPQEIRIQTPH